MAKPLSSLVQILMRPQHKELFQLSLGLAEISRPLAGFLKFCIGKLFITVMTVALWENMMPGFMSKPFSMYLAIATQLLTPLGLHLFLAYQEVVFYSFCSYYQKFAKVVMETAEDEQRLDQSSATEKAKQNNIVVYGKSSDETLHGNLRELIEMMKNMTETFGPFLLQNFSLMLLYWLLHLYFLFFTVIQTMRNLGGFLSEPFLMGLNCLQFAGGLLIVR